jgi:hypothetical protein
LVTFGLTPALHAYGHGRVGFFCDLFFFSSPRSPSCIHETSLFTIHSVSFSLLNHSPQRLLFSPTVTTSQHPATPVLRPALLERCSGGHSGNGFREEGPPVEVIGRCDTHPKPSVLHGGRLPSRGVGLERWPSHGEVCALNPTPPPPTCSTATPALASLVP